MAFFDFLKGEKGKRIVKDFRAGIAEGFRQDTKQQPQQTAQGEVGRTISNVVRSIPRGVGRGIGSAAISVDKALSGGRAPLTGGTYDLQNSAGLGRTFGQFLIGPEPLSGMRSESMLTRQAFAPNRQLKERPFIDSVIGGALSAFALADVTAAATGVARGAARATAKTSATKAANVVDAVADVVPPSSGGNSVSMTDNAVADVMPDTQTSALETYLKGGNDVPSTEVQVGRKRGFYQTLEKSGEFDQFGPFPDETMDTFPIRSQEALRQQADDLVRVNPEEAQRIADGLDPSVSEDFKYAVSYRIMDELKKTANDAMLSGDVQLADNIAEQMRAQIKRTAEARTETARALAMGIQDFADGNMAENVFTKFVSYIDDQNYKLATNPDLADVSKPIRGFSNDEFLRLYNTASEIDKMPAGEDRNLALFHFRNEMFSRIPSELADQIIGVLRANILTGPGTLAVSTTSNTIGAAARFLENMIAVPLDNAISFIRGTERTTVDPVGAAKEYWKGLTKKGFDDMMTIMKTGYDPRDADQLSNKINFDFQNTNYGTSAMGRALKKYVDTVYSLMSAIDVPFYRGAERASLYRQAVIRAEKLGLNGDEATKYIQDFIENPPENVALFAVADADTLVLRNTTDVYGATTKLVDAMNIGTGKNWFSPKSKQWLGDVIVPFKKTPSAFINEMANYVLPTSVVPIVKAIRTGKPLDQKTFVRLFSKNTMGFVGGAVIGRELNQAGMLSTGIPPISDDATKERATTGAMNITQPSIKIGNKWVPIATFGPLGVSILAGGAYDQAMKEVGSPTAAAGAAIAQAGRAFLDSPFVTGVKNVSDMIADLASDEKNGSVDRFMASVAGMAVPSIYADMVQSLGEFAPKADTVKDRVISRLLPSREGFGAKPKLDYLGRPIESTEEGKEGIGWGALRFLNPQRMYNVRTDPLVNEITRLRKDGYDINNSKITGTLGKFKLDKDEYYAYQAAYGTVIDEIMPGIIDSADYQDADDDFRAEIIAEGIATAKQIAREEYMPYIISKRYDLPEDIDSEELMVAVKELYTDSRFAGASKEKQKKIILDYLEL